MVLTPEQREALWDSEGNPVRGYCIVSARAGTGKTTMLTEYCLDLVRTWTSSNKPWQGIAVLSYTNVAKNEIEARIQKYGHGSALLAGPHFVGTIDSFTNQYIFLPFGASLMGYAGRPKLVGEPYGQWRADDALRNGHPKDAYSLVFFDCYSFASDGSSILVDKNPRRVSAAHERKAEEPTSRNSHRINNLKRYVWSHGYATQSDANYLAYRVLREYSTITQSLIRRFPVLIVDEAQDMTEVQHALLNHLRNAGLQHIVLVGDEYQAIYEWNTAKPKLFTARKTDGSWNPKTIRSTFRCSPAICRVLANLANDGIAIEPAVEGKNKGYDLPVQVREYDKAEEASAVLVAIDDMAKLLADRNPHANGASMRSIAILARSAAQVPVLRGYFTGEETRQARPAKWKSKHTKDYLRVVFYLSRGDVYAAAGAYENLLLSLSEHGTKADLRADLARAWSAGETDLVRYRTYLFADLQAISDAIPSKEPIRISQCHTLCQVALHGLPEDILAEVAKDCRSFMTDAKDPQDQLVSALFAAKEDRTYLPHPSFPNVQLVFSTVHGAKGETYDGAIFFARDRSDSCGCPSGSSNQWSRILQHNLLECENKRIVYVALSRAAQALYVLAPAGGISAWKGLLGGASS